MHGSPAADQSGLLIRSSSNVKVTCSEFQQLDHAISMMSSTGVRIEDNEFHDLRADGLVSAGTSSVQTVSNGLTDFYPVEGDHPYAIQFLTRGTTASARDISISDNLIDRGEGGITQGIFMTDQVGTLPYQNVTITNNVLVGTMYSDIAVANDANITVGGNTVAALSDMKSFIQVLNVNGAVVTNNSAAVFNYTGTTNLTTTGNVVVTAVLDGGSALISAWLAAHDGVISGGSGSDPLPGGETEIIAETVLGTSGDDRMAVDGTHDTRLEGMAGNDLLRRRDQRPAGRCRQRHLRHQRRRRCGRRSRRGGDRRGQHQRQLCADRQCRDAEPAGAAVRRAGTAVGGGRPRCAVPPGRPSPAAPLPDRPSVRSGPWSPEPAGASEPAPAPVRVRRSSWRPRSYRVRRRRW